VKGEELLEKPGCIGIVGMRFIDDKDAI